MASVQRITTPKGLVRYRARWRDPEGKARERWFTKKGEADRFAASMATDVARGQYLAPDAGRVTFADYASNWLAIQAVDPSTRQAMGIYLRVHILPALGSARLADIRPSSVAGLVHRLSETLAPRTVRQVIATLSAILAAAVEDGLLRTNPATAKSVRLPRPDSRKVEPWTPAQVAAIQVAMPARYSPLVTMGAGLGLRQGEAFGLAVEDVDFLRGVVTVQRQVKMLGSRLLFALPKGRKVRTIPMPMVVRDHLAAHLAAYPAREITLPFGDLSGEPMTAALLMTSREGKPLNRNYINPGVWKPALVAAGIAPTRDHGSHMLRHTYASVLLDRGVSIRAVSEHLGHSDPGFTLRTYTHLMPSGEDRVRAAIDDSWGSGGVDAGLASSE